MDNLLQNRKIQKMSQKRSFKKRFNLYFQSQSKVEFKLRIATIKTTDFMCI